MSDPGPQISPPSHEAAPAPREAPRRPLDVQRLPDHHDRLFRAAYALCGRREDAEDLVQETYLQVLRRPRFLRRDEDLSYLLRALRNTWISIHRQRTRRPQTVAFDETIDFVIDPGADPGVSVAELKTIYAAVHELSPPLRDTLVAVDIVGLSYKQAARVLEVPVGTVMSRLFRGRDTVAERLERSGAVEPRPERSARLDPE